MHRTQDDITQGLIAQHGMREDEARKYAQTLLDADEASARRWAGEYAKPGQTWMPRLGASLHGLDAAPIRLTDVSTSRGYARSGSLYLSLLMLHESYELAEEAPA